MKELGGCTSIWHLLLLLLLLLLLQLMDANIIRAGWMLHGLGQMVMSNHFCTIVIKLIFMIATRVEILFFLIYFVRFTRVIVIVIILDLVYRRSIILGIPILLCLRHVELHSLIGDLLLLRVSS